MKFLKYFCAASLLAASAGTLWSCDDDDDKRLSDAVLASVSSLTFEAQDTSEKIITVYADADWVTEIPDWVTVTPTEGTGVMDVTVSVSENMRDGAMDQSPQGETRFQGTDARQPCRGARLAGRPTNSATFPNIRRSAT